MAILFTPLVLGQKFTYNKYMEHLRDLFKLFLEAFEGQGIPHIIECLNFCPWWPRILSKHVELQAQFGDVNNSFLAGLGAADNKKSLLRSSNNPQGLS